MTEEKQGTDNPTQDPTPIPESAGTTEQSASDGPPKFEGKTREDVIRVYSDLERKMHDQGQQLSQAEQFIRQVGIFFQADPESGKIDWNDEMGKKLAETRGWASPSSNETPQEQPSQTSNGEEFMEQFEKNPAPTIEKIVQDAVAKAVGDAVSPLQQQVQQQQHNAWIEKVRAKHPDFDQYRTQIGNLMNTHNMQVSNEEQLENAYKAAKAISGGLVDKGELEKAQSELQKTLSVLRPAGNVHPPVNEDTASDEELLGLNTLNDNQSKVTRALFGKAFIDND